KSLPEKCRCSFNCVCAFWNAALTFFMAKLHWRRQVWAWHVCGWKNLHTVKKQTGMERSKSFLRNGLQQHRKGG
ncbi:MAG: hypothetical protein ACOYN4_07810, partial [Bacteroidales bacterium]